MKIMIINGPNLNFLGIREKEIYSTLSYEDLCLYIASYPIFKNVNFDFLQSNIEGEIVNFIQKAYIDKYDAIILNPGGYTHTSVSIYDALKAVSIPTIEVHISNIYSRENFRKKSLIAGACIGQISGLGKDSYILAIKYILDNYRKDDTK